MQTYNIHQAKTHLSELVALAERGEEVIIARANKPAVRLVPVSPQPQKRVAGLMEKAEGTDGADGWMSDDFDEYLLADFLISPTAK